MHGHASGNVAELKTLVARIEALADKIAPVSASSSVGATAAASPAISFVLLLFCVCAISVFCFVFFPEK